MLHKLCKIFHLDFIEKGETEVAVPRGERDCGGEWRNYFMAPINFEDLVVCLGDKYTKLCAWMYCVVTSSDSQVTLIGRIVWTCIKKAYVTAHYIFSLLRTCMH
jgi:hypothetical protein